LEKDQGKGSTCEKRIHRIEGKRKPSGPIQGKRRGGKEDNKYTRAKWKGEANFLL